MEVRVLKMHSSLNHAGKNFGETVEPAKLTGCKLTWDAKKSWFEITYNNRTGYIFANNVSYWEPLVGEVVSIVNEHKTEHVDGRRRAQVSTPMGHVFEGPGAGKTRQ